MCVCAHAFSLHNIVHLYKKDLYEEKKYYIYDSVLYIAHSDNQIHYESPKISKRCLCIAIVQSGFHVNALSQLMKLILRKS